MSFRPVSPNACSWISPDHEKYLDDVLATLDGGQEGASLSECVPQSSAVPTAKAKNSGSTSPHPFEPSVAPEVSPVRLVYAFPVEPLAPRLRALDDRQLVDALSAAWRRVVEHYSDDYLKLRDLICAINIELNRRGKLAPRVRPMRKKRMDRNPKQAGNFAGDPKERWKSRDRQVIDLHWIYSRNVFTNDMFRPARLSPEIAALCWNEIFSFDLASKFACEKKYAATKAEELRIARNWEWELSSLCHEETQEAFRRLSKLAHTFERCVRERAQADHRLRGRSGDWEFVWLAGQVADGAPLAAHRIYEVFTGMRIDIANFRKRLVRVNEVASGCFA